MSSTDSIERSVVIHAPVSRVWHALVDAEAFGRWFRADLTGKRFAPGERARGRITYPGYEHLYFDVMVERIEPQALFSFRWHPYAVETSVDSSQEEPTLVTFTLQPVAEGTLLKVVESGFDRIPPQRRGEAFRMNSGGWEAQMENIVAHVGAQG
jgi:uncharacterized protein YndB with AHSA1/START domain